MKKYWMHLAIHDIDDPKNAVEIQLPSATAQQLRDIAQTATSTLIEGGMVTPPINPQLPTTTHARAGKLELSPAEPAPYNPPPKMKRRSLFKRDKTVPKPDGFDDKEVQGV